VLCLWAFLAFERTLMKNPAGSPDSIASEEIAARGLIGHLRQVFHVDMGCIQSSSKP